MARTIRTVVNLLESSPSYRSLRALPNLPRIRGTIGKAWERCLTGRVFVLTVWATLAVASLVPAASAQAGSAPDELSPATYSVPHTPVAILESDRECIPAVGDTEPQATIVASETDAEVVSACWGAAQLHVPEAWKAAAPLRTVLVAVLDTGIDVDNPRLSERIIASVDIVGRSNGDDLYGHGTHIAGTIAAIAPNSLLLNVKVADDRGSCDSRHVAAGIRVAVDRGAEVINLSLQVDPSPELEAAIDYAWDEGAVLVAAAGAPLPDSSTVQGSREATDAAVGPCRPRMSAPVFPAWYFHTIAVTGTNEEGDLAPVSNRASWVDVAAPGCKTVSDMPNGETGYLTGTSTAAAHVAGIAALLCGLARDQNGDGHINDEVRYAIESTAEPLDVEGTGSGIVNAAAAVAEMAA